MDTVADLDLTKGTELHAARKFADAAAFFRDVLDRQPASPDAYIGLGRALTRQRLYDEAIEQYRKAEALVASNAEDKRSALLHLSWDQALAWQGRFKEASDQYRAALRVDPNDKHTVVPHILFKPWY